MLSENSLKCAQALGRLNVADDAHNHHGRCFHDGHSLHGLLFVQLGSELVDITHNMGHAGLVADESGQVDRLAFVVLGKGFTFAAMSFGSFFGQEAQRTVTWMFEFTMTLLR